VALLLDTHAYLWFLVGDARLSPAAAALIRHPDERVLVSVISAWEIVIKAATGKLVLRAPVEDLWRMGIEDYGFEPLDVTAPHVFALSPLSLHHRDPFDRLLIAQAIAEGLPIVSADAVFDAYPVERIW
jgi:PIN domain nuclease of toxin-antitoxin system